MTASINLITYFVAGCGWLLFSYLYISVGEHQIHKRLMHGKPLPGWFYARFPYVLATFEAHGVRHHTRWYREFDYEPNLVGREENLPIPMKETVLMLGATFPLWTPIFMVSVYGGCIFLATVLAHNRLWSALHRQMHIPLDTFFGDWGVFRYVGINHYLHHQDTRRNFNVVFPFADWLFGTRARPTRAGIRELLRIGYLLPRTRAGQAVVDRWRAETRRRRETSAATAQA